MEMTRPSCSPSTSHKAPQPNPTQPKSTDAHNNASPNHSLLLQTPAQIIDVLHPGRANVPKAELQEIIAGVRAACRVLGFDTRKLWRCRLRLLSLGLRFPLVVILDVVVVVVVRSVGWGWLRGRRGLRAVSAFLLR